MWAVSLTAALFLGEILVRAWAAAHGIGVGWAAEIVYTNRGFSPRLDPDRAYPYTYSRIATDGRSRLEIAYPDGTRRSFPFVEPPGVYRIVVVGDSITELWGVPGYRNFTTYLEQDLVHPDRRRIEVLPLGIGGYNHHAERHYFADHFADLEFDLLLVQDGPNDVEVLRVTPTPIDRIDLDDQFRCPGVASIDLSGLPKVGASQRWPGQRLFGLYCAVPDDDRTPVLGLPSRVRWLLERRSHSGRDPLWGLVPFEANRQLREALVWFAAHARKRDAKMAVVLFPWDSLDHGAAFNGYVERILDEEGVPWWSLTDWVERRGAWASFFREGDRVHPSDWGHRLAARFVIEEIARRRLW